MDAAPADAFRRIPDQAYGPPEDGLRRLDLWVPTAEGPHPVVLLLHGGSWNTGSRKGFELPIRRMLARGLAVATASYRLAPEHGFPVPLSDARCGVRWLRRHAAEHDLDPNRIGALGLSAGGHLATMLATAAGDDGLNRGCPHDDEDASVAGAVAWAAPYDLRPEAGLPNAVHREVAGYLEGSPKRLEKRAAHASPIVHVDGDDAPVLLVHGTEDRTVPIAQARSMRAALDKAGVESRLVPVKGGHHGLQLLGTAPALEPATCATLAFFERTLGLR